jgi:threonine/homoserine/homoserine lactone efflux protein
MLTFDTVLSFFGIAVLLGLSPGPDNLFVLMQSAMWGRVSGMFAASETAFVVLKLAGALYLVYLAYGAFRAPATLDTGEKPPPQSRLRLYQRGIIMNLSNPKVSIFFLAFLPQFTDPSRGSVALQTLSLGGLFMVATLLVFGLAAWFAGALGERLQGSRRAQRALNWTAGTVFLGLALRLAFMGSDPVRGG